MAVIGAGTWEVAVEQHYLAKSSKGTPCVEVVLQDIESLARITYFGYLSDAALEYTLKSLETMGWNPHEHDGRITSLNGTELLVGNVVQIVVEEEEFEGKLRPKVKWINPSGGGIVGDPMEEKEAEAFSVDLRKKIFSHAGPKPSTRPGPARPPKRNDVQRKARELPQESRAGLPGVSQQPDFSDDFDLDDIPF